VYSYWSSGRARDRINHDAHIFGALTGLAFAAVTAPERLRDLLHSF
jgi:membrane associated rhomboid family serine protease